MPRARADSISASPSKSLETRSPQDGAREDDSKLGRSKMMTARGGSPRDIREAFRSFSNGNAYARSTRRLDGPTPDIW